MSLTAKILVLIFLFTSTFAIGLQTDFKEFPAIIKAKKLLIRSLLANFIIIPLIGILIAKTIPMPTEISFAIIMLALTPGGFNAIQFVSKIKGEAAFAGFIVFLLALLSVFISPLLIMLFVPANITLVIPYQKILLLLLFFILMPLGLGNFIHYKIEAIAKKLIFPFALVGTLAFFSMIALTFKQRQTAMSVYDLEIIGIMLIFVLVSMLVGWLMGGPAKKTRQILAIVSNMRNTPLCLMIAMETLPQAKVIPALVALSALMIVPNFVLTVVFLKGRGD